MTLEETLEETLDELAVELQHTDADELGILQERYYYLRILFAHLLFDLKSSPQDHYSWLLMDHDATYSLNKLVLTHHAWQQTKASDVSRQAYERELDDFKWIVATAMLCRP